MRYANVSVKFPEDLDAEINRFIDETGVYTNKSEFIKEACRSHLEQLNDDSAILALRLEKLLERAEQQPVSDAEIRARLGDLRGNVDAEDVETAVDEARDDTQELLQDDT